MTRTRILVIDDEPQILRFLEPALKAVDFDVITAGTGAEAIKLCATKAPDVILLDLGLPDRDGKDVIQNIRSWSNTPIIVLSARDRETEKIDSLDLGADDYINKPFNIGELLARIRTQLRHRQGLSVTVSVFNYAGIQIDTAKHQVKKNGAAIHLTPKEFDLLLLLIKNVDRVLTHKQILNTIWGPAHTEDLQYLRVMVGQIRQKIETNPSDPAILLTEAGVGYRFATDTV
jgi:two-component system, OmpR family, KDP operon response regulator KdpE